MWNGVGGSTTVYTATWPRFRPSDFRKGTDTAANPFALRLRGPRALVRPERRQLRRQRRPRRPGDPAPRPLPDPAAAARSDRPGRGRRLRPARLALVDDARRDHRRRLRRPSRLQPLRGLPVRLPARFAQRHVAHPLAEGDRGRGGASDQRPRRPIETNDEGRATGAEYVDRMTGTHHFQAADVVVLAANGVGTPRCCSSRRAAVIRTVSPTGAAGRPQPHAPRVGAGRDLDRAAAGPTRGSSRGPSSVRSSPSPIRRGGSSTASRCTSCG